MKKYILLIILISIGLTGKSQFDITAEVIQRKMSITIVVEDVQKPGFRNIAKIITEKEGVNGFIDVMIQIANESRNNPDKVKGAPYNTVITRLDEAKAARTPVLKYTFDE